MFIICIRFICSLIFLSVHCCMGSSPSMGMPYLPFKEFSLALLLLRESEL